MTMPLQRGVVYGPVRSRRYGRSLGINLMPAACKICSFDCAYCQYGPTRHGTRDLAPFARDLPAAADVTRAVEEALPRCGALELITFSGNGEPTLHPDFPALVDAVARLRDRHQPGARLALLSNSTGLGREEVRRSLARIDLPVMKLDAGTSEAFRAVNRPAPGVDFEEIVDWLASLSGIYLQTVFVDGTPSNVHELELASYYARLARIQPREVHIYSTDRPVPEAGILLVPPARLEAIAAAGRERTGVSLRAFYAR